MSSPHLAPRAAWRSLTVFSTSALLSLMVACSANEDGGNPGLSAFEGAAPPAEGRNDDGAGAESESPSPDGSEGAARDADEPGEAAERPDSIDRSPGDGAASNDAEATPEVVNGVEDAADEGGGDPAPGGADEANPDDESADPEASSDPAEEGFQPCPQTGACRVLPLGDSITFGLGFDGGYRVELFRLALEAGHEITFTGTQQPNGPNQVNGVAFPRGHEGISGQTIAQIDGRVPAPALNEPPHIVLLHAGTNDMFAGAGGAPDRLGALMDDLIAEAPDALIVVSSIIPLSFGGDNVNSFNATIPGMVEQRASAGAHIAYVDQFAGFPTSELGDGVHPNQAGYARMARVWFEAISEFLR